MTIEHKNIPEIHLHELKGASTALLDTIPVGTGGGSTTFQRNLLSDHADMLITNNATVTNVVAAVDPTLNTDTDYVEVTTSWAAGHQTGISFNVKSLQVAVTGNYMLSFWASIMIPTTNSFLAIKFGINSTPPLSSQKIVSQSATANDYRNLFGMAIVSLTAGDTVSIYTASSKTNALKFEEAGLNMFLLHE